MREPRLIRLSTRYQRVFDLLLALAVTFVAVGGLGGWHRGAHATGRHAPTAVIVIAGLGALTLVFRRAHPRIVFACVLAAVFVNGLAPGSPRVTTAALFVALASLVQRRTLNEGIAAGAAAYVAIVAGEAIGRGHLSAGFLASQAVLIVGMTTLALFIGTRRAYLDQLRARARDLERERELLAERAVADERVRIARELHDAVAHHVSLLVVQAGAIRESLPPDAPQRGVADSMAATGRQALSEMRNMLGLLRTGNGTADAAAEHEPQPGAGDIPALVARTTAAGVATDLSVDGDERPLPVGVDLSAYRIVQESLTNVVKHAHAAHAHALLRYRPDALEVRVSDDGRGGDGGGGGHGIVGMRERVALFGGELFAGPADDGGWEVRAVLPLEPQP